MCDKRRRFSDKHDADLRSLSLAEEMGTPRMCVYRCAQCGLWCLSSKRPHDDDRVRVFEAPPIKQKLPWD